GAQDFAGSGVEGMSDSPSSAVRGQLLGLIVTSEADNGQLTTDYGPLTMIEDKKLTRNSLFWRLWLRALTVKRAQTGVALVSLLLGAATVSMLANLYGGVRRKMTQEFRTYGANVVVAQASGPADVVSRGAAAGALDAEVVL